jgi:hypothetical protein
LQTEPLKPAYIYDHLWGDYVVRAKDNHPKKIAGTLVLRDDIPESYDDNASLFFMNLLRNCPCLLLRKFSNISLVWKSVTEKLFMNGNKNGYY